MEQQDVFYDSAEYIETVSVGSIVLVLLPQLISCMVKLFFQELVSPARLSHVRSLAGETIQELPRL